VKQTRDFTLHAAIPTCQIHPLFRRSVKKKEKNFVNIWQGVEQGSIQREHGLMGAASSNVAGISELGKDVYIRYKTAMSESWTVFSLGCIMQFQYFIRQLPLVTLVYCINVAHVYGSP
jgi:Tat protein secretion system quality control protein TatD with DNase activity